MKFRDPSAWYHLVVAVDTTQSVETDRVKFYVNGVLQSTVMNASYTLSLAQSFDTNINSATSHTFGGLNIVSPTYWNGYLAEAYLIDGQALSASYFGQTDFATGQWIPKAYSGTYGTNGFYLPFNDATSTATLGYDRQVSLTDSSKNNWTPSGFNTYDQVLDSPTNNFCTLNPADNGGCALTSGALGGGYSGGDNRSVRSSFPTLSGDKAYCEFTYTSDGGNGSMSWLTIGLVDSSYSLTAGTNYPGVNSTSWGWQSHVSLGALRRNSGSYSNYGTNRNVGDTLRIAVDRAAGRIWVGDSTGWFSSGDPVGGTNPMYSGLPTTGELYFCFSSQNNNALVFNFGQGGQTGLTYNASSGGRFKYTPPAGFKALCTANLTAPTIKNPSQYFATLTWTGDDAASRDLSGLSFQPDLVWNKNRSGTTGHHQWTDSVRTAPQNVFSNLTIAEQVGSSDGQVSAFLSNGFRVTAGGTTKNSVNALNNNYVAWCWKAGTSAQTGSESYSSTAGFSIVKYSYTGTNTVSHSLGVKPAMMIIKRRNSSGDWAVWHQSFSSQNQNYLLLDSTAGVSSDATIWAGIAPGTGTFNVNNATYTNASGGTYIAYLWAEVSSFSKFGSYTGNGSADGPFVYCGFKPRWLMAKRSDSTGSWIVLDGERDSGNPVARYLVTNNADGELLSGVPPFDLLSNGFKVRATVPAWNELNASSGTYIFAAFAEAPFKYATAR